MFYSRVFCCCTLQYIVDFLYKIPFQMLPSLSVNFQLTVFTGPAEVRELHINPQAYIVTPLCFPRPVGKRMGGGIFLDRSEADKNYFRENVYQNLYLSLPTCDKHTNICFREVSWEEVFAKHFSCQLLSILKTVQSIWKKVSSFPAEKFFSLPALNLFLACHIILLASRMKKVMFSVLRNQSTYTVQCTLQEMNFTKITYLTILRSGPIK